MTESSDRKPTAIVVNDNATQRKVLAELLGKGGLEVIEFDTAEAALEALAAGRRSDLIVTDLYMPGIDGWRFCRLLRSPDYEPFNDTPILVVSATFSGEEPANIAAHLGANAFLPQPVEPHRLFEVVNALLRNEAPRQKPSVLIVEDEQDLAELLRKTFERYGYNADLALTGGEALEKCNRRLTAANRGAAIQSMSTASNPTGGAPHVLDPRLVPRSSCSEGESPSGEVGSRFTCYDSAVLDYHLPDMKADELLRDFRSRCPGCAVVMITGDTNPELAVAWMKAGAAAYAIKPFDPNYLVELCVRACRERALLRTEEILEERTRDLRESEAFNTALFDYSPIETIVVDREGRIVRWNKAQSEDRLPAVGDRMYVDYAGRHETDMRAALMECIESGETREFSEQKYGDKVLSINIAPFPTDNPHSGVITSQDVTKRKQAEEELKETHARLRTLFEKSPDAIFVEDLDGNMLDVNPATCSLHGMAREELIGKNVLDLVPSEVQGAVKRDYPNWSAGKLEEYEGSSLTKSGDAVPVEIRGSRIIYAGTPAILLHVRDITERLALEAQVRQSKKLESVGTLAGGVAHEINNPINGIMNYAQLILDKLGPDSPVAEFAAEIGDETRRVATIVRNLLSFSRPQKQEYSPARMCDIVEVVLSLIRSVLLHDQIALEVDVPEDLPKINCRSQQMEQVIMNLLTNARDALDKKYPGYDEDKKIIIRARRAKRGSASANLRRRDFGGREATADKTRKRDQESATSQLPSSELGASRSDRWLRLTIEDHGPGIPEEARERLFEPFYTSKRPDKGTGLGLSISYTIVKEHGGALSVESKVGKRTRFHVDLPTGQRIQV